MILRRGFCALKTSAPLAVATIVLTAMLASCTSGPNVCGPVITDELDPLSDQHVLPTSEISYLTNPPTSGPHLSLPPPAGALDSVISPALQVTALEAGSVIIHYGPGQDVASLAELAAADVVVAPGQDLPAEVVFTAWQTRQSCSAPDIAAARSFIRDHAGKGVGHG